MYFSWLDRWDENRAGRSEELKKEVSFALGAEYAFPNSSVTDSLAEFCELADEAVVDTTFFSAPENSDLEISREKQWIKFPSSISTDVPANNVVWTKYKDGGSLDHALVVFHHWNASKRNRHLANFFAGRGISVFEMALPYHLERSRPASTFADNMLSPNLGLTLQSVRQGVLDGLSLIGWLKKEGYRDISVLGMSLGSWIAGLVAAHETSVSKAALLLTAGSLADMVWTGRATQAIQQCLEPEMSLADLRRAWGPLNLENHTQKFARPNFDLQVVLASRDKVVLPEISQRLIQTLRDNRVRQNTLELNCGHYSLALPPHMIIAGIRLQRFLMAGIRQEI